MGALARLTCKLLGHRAAPGAAWNHGYCFGHCLRCGAPIMRAVFGSWRPPPRGYRIVWPHRGGRFAVAPAPPVPAWTFMDDGATEARPDRSSPPPASMPLRDPFAFDDFMDDDPTPLPPPDPTRRRRAS